MKIIEALKKIKANRIKMDDLTRRISENSAHMESAAKSLPYKNPVNMISEWSQSISSLSQDNSLLLTRIQKTNLATNVTIEIDGKQITKTISQWVIRRREGVDQEVLALTAMTNRRLTPQATKDKDGNIVVDSVVLSYNQETRDNRLAILKEEKSLIDSALEIVNATTDLLE